MVTKDEILVILETFIHSENSDYENIAYTHGLNDAAEAVIELVESQPVDRVQAMILFVENFCSQVYYVPDVGEKHIVDMTRDEIWCSCGEQPGCDHIKAVKLYQEQDK